jgi:hypothetical protein
MLYLTYGAGLGPEAYDAFRDAYLRAAMRPGYHFA